MSSPISTSKLYPQEVSRVRQEKHMLTNHLQKGEAALPPAGRTLPVCTNKDDLKFLACLLDLPVRFHQDSGEASAGWALKDKSGILQRDDVAASRSPFPTTCHQRPGKQDPRRAGMAQPGLWRGRNKRASRKGDHPALTVCHQAAVMGTPQGLPEAASEWVRRAILLDQAKEVTLLLLWLFIIIVHTYCLPTVHRAWEKGSTPGLYASSYTSRSPSKPVLVVTSLLPSIWAKEGPNTHPVCGEIDSHVRPLQAAALQGLPIISKQGPCNDFPERFRSPREFQT